MVASSTHVHCTRLTFQEALWCSLNSRVCFSCLARAGPRLPDVGDQRGVLSGGEVPRTTRGADRVARALSTC